MKKKPEARPRKLLWLCAMFVAMGALLLPALAQAKQRYAKFNGEILSVSRTGMMVRGRNSYTVRNFTYTPALGAKVTKILNERGKPSIHNGANVEIVYLWGSDVASRIKAKS